MFKNNFNNIVIKTHTDINEINREQWDKLAENSTPFYDYGWFKSFQCLLGNPLYIAAYDNDKLVGVLPGFIVTDTDTYLYHNHRDAFFCRNEIDFCKFLERKKKKHYSYTLKTIAKISKSLESIFNKVFFPAYVCISPRGFVGDLLSENNSIGSTILGNIKSIVSRYGVRCISFMWVLESNKNLINLLKENKFKQLVGEFYFELKLKTSSLNNGFSDFKSSVRQKHKKVINKLSENNYVADYYANIDIIVKNIDYLSEVGGKQAEKRGDIIDSKFYKKSLLKLNKEMGDSLYCVVIRNEQKIVGFDLGCQKMGKLYPKFGWYDESLNRKLLLHSNLLYSQHVLNATRENKTAIWYGAGDPEAKSSRGAHAVIGNCFYHFQGRLIVKGIFYSLCQFINLLKRYIYMNSGVDNI